MSRLRRLLLGGLVATADLIFASSAARAELVLSQLVVELSPGDHSRSDVEIWNKSAERTYVAVEPREIIGAGTNTQSSHTDPDPEKLGLLVSPARIILEPGQRKLLRIASLTPLDRERVFRVTIKPVVGELASQNTGLKVLVGYDMLVLVRPSQPKPHVSGIRTGDTLTLKNDGNVSVELVEGRACQRMSAVCQPLPEGRLYAGAERTIKVDADRTAQFKVKLGAKSTALSF